MRCCKDGRAPFRRRSIRMIRPAGIMSAHKHSLSHVRGSVVAVLAACIGANTLAAQTVDVVKVISRKNERKVQLPGEFMAYQSVAVRAKVTGFVEQVRVDRGSLVKEGELLATLVAPELTAQRVEAEAKVHSVESQRAEAEAKVASAQSTYDKLKAASQTPG